MLKWPSCLKFPTSHKVLPKWLLWLEFQTSHRCPVGRILWAYGFSWGEYFMKYSEKRYSQTLGTPYYTIWWTLLDSDSDLVAKLTVVKSNFKKILNGFCVIVNLWESHFVLDSGQGTWEIWNGLIVKIPVGKIVLVEFWFYE